MNRELKIYRNIIPNIDYFKIYNNYNSFLNNLIPYLIDTFTIDNYRIESDSVISLSNDDDIVSSLTYITYAIEILRNDYDEIVSLRCYHVYSSFYQSNKCILNINIDYFGTYIKPLLSNEFRIKVNKCNRNIGEGYYDKIEGIKVEDNILKKYLESEGSNDVGIPFQVEKLEKINLQYNYNSDSYSIQWVDFPLIIDYRAFTLFCQISSSASSNLYGYQRGGVSYMYFNRITEIESHIYYEGNFPSSIVKGISELIGSSISVENGWLNDLKLLPNNYGYLIPSVMFNSNELNTNDSIEVNYKNKHKNGRVKYKIFSSPTKISESTLYLRIKNYNPFRKYFIGTITQLLDVKNTTKNPMFVLRTELSFYNIQVILSQQEESIDLSESFKFFVNNSNEFVSPMTQLKNTIKVVEPLVNGISSGIRASGGSDSMKGGYGKMLLSPFKAFSEMSNENNNISKNIVSDSSSIENCLSTYINRNTSNYSSNPIICISYDVIDSEYYKDQFLKYGANVNEFISSNDLNMNNRAFYINDESNYYTYIRGDLICEKGIPLNALEFIKERFNTGIMYEWVN